MFEIIEKILTAIEDYGTWFLFVFLIGVAVGYILR